MVRSVSKSRLMRFSEKVRRNFDKFKDRIEKIGKRTRNLLPSSEILMVGVFGYWGLMSLSDMKETIEATDYSLAEGFNILCSQIYSGCKTKQDSINAAKATLTEVTGSSDPKIWAKIFNDGVGVLDDPGLELIFYATIPYADQE